MRHKFKSTLFTIATMALLSGCSSDSGTEDELTMTPFTINFSAMSGDQNVDCDAMVSGFGNEGHYSIGVSDLRFYVSNIELFDQYGEKIEASFDSNEFQLNHDLGFVGLVDLTSNSSGKCTSDAIPNSEGTARTNNVMTGKMIDTGVNKITFDIGVPQAIMKEVIATQSAEDAPSPLNEMYWSWASGYRHFVMNFAIESMMGNTGEGYIHIGSRGCGDDSLLALENKEKCDFVNTPKVEITDFEPNMDTVVIRIDKLLDQLSFAPAMSSHGDHTADTEMMDSPSVTCHSASPEMQPDCAAIFQNLGLSTDDGSSSSDTNQVVQH
ncbi:metallo-mystery pair system four-Cys motif protein [Psychrosphaera sp. 1_MG-2023]|nr:MbnP family copper-binding protein [Psychrosphaera sp. 1_MG-2023]MDO6718514.1 metallo-mystery pair system four-Cys motif protein [Psychrosphaera sp. 1_MG-2023]